MTESVDSVGESLITVFSFDFLQNITFNAKAIGAALRCDVHFACKPGVAPPALVTGYTTLEGDQVHGQYSA